jgi:hypothetical protein
VAGIRHHRAAVALAGRAVEPVRFDRTVGPDKKAEPGTAAEPDTEAAAGRRAAVRRTAVEGQPVGPHTRAADRDLVRTRAERHRRAAEELPVLFRTTADTGAARLRALLHRLVERCRRAAEERPGLLSMGPAEGRRVPSGRRWARWGLDRLVLLL